MTQLTINIIPSDYAGNPKSALGYCWEDYASKTPGIDIVAEKTDNGIDYIAIAKKAIKDNGAKSAYVNCMWGGGFSGEIKLDTEKVETETVSAPLTIAEESAQTKTVERIERKAEINNHIGWCNKCQSYCYGDCEANY